MLGYVGRQLPAGANGANALALMILGAPALSGATTHARHAGSDQMRNEQCLSWGGIHEPPLRFGMGPVVLVTLSDKARGTLGRELGSYYT